MGSAAGPPQEFQDRLTAALADRYALAGEIGRGGMAIVFRARDRRHERDVAIKVLRPEVAAALGGERFLREIRIESRLQHPNVLAVHDSGEADGILYYVMPFVEGESLRDRLQRENQLPIEEALQVTREVGDALFYAHAQGVVHRDVKPENILLASGHAVLADFGIARAIEEAGGSRLTATGVTVGTPLYMSPEQAAGEARLDGRSDIYSLACVLYEMLTGQPPFTGTTEQTIRARHLHERPPPIDVVRPTTPPAVIEAIELALAKVPADRFATAADFVAALTRPGHARRQARRGVPPVVTRVAAVGGVAVVVTLWLVLRPQPPPLDRNKVVVFPLVEQGVSPGNAGAGYGAAVMIENALDHAPPLKWIDGWDRLAEDQRADPATISAGLARRIARDRVAHYYLTGVIQTVRDSTTVTLALHDASGDSLVRRHHAAGANVDVHRLAVDAVKGLLPHLLDPGREVDLAPLRDRDASAIALFLRAEREYRSVRMGAALESYRLALARDSALALAALKGAQAATWEHRFREARDLVAAAVRHEALLPERFALLSRGLDAYTSGRADSAVMWLQQAVTAAPGWAEASTALGEVFFHLIPARWSLDSLAEEAFTVAAGDSGFTPPLYHLSELAIGRGDLRRAERMISRFSRADPDPALAQQLVLMLDCVRDGPSGADWSGVAGATPLPALVAAKRLAAAGAHPTCGEAGFLAVLASPAAGEGERWGALLGLQGVLVATGRHSEARALVDSAIAAGTSLAMVLHIVNSLAGAPFEAKAIEVESFARRTFGDRYERMRPAPRLWLFSAWHTRQRDVRTVRAIHEEFARRLAAGDGDRVTALLGSASAAHLVLVMRDTARAIRQLRALVPTAVLDSLAWQIEESLPYERLLLSRLLLATGQAEEAMHVAAVFDHPGPVAFLPFLPASLVLRRAAAEQLGRRDLANRYADRLIALGRDDLVGSRP